MVDIEFDDHVASGLRRTLTSVADTLRGQSGERSTAVGAALADFSGAYADRFRDAAVIESEDRARLAGVLIDLGVTLESVIRAAAEERARLADHAAWRSRETTRQRMRADAGVLAGIAPVLELVDREPSTVAVRPEPLVAVFTARDRPRNGDGRTGDTSSADPDQLRGFATSSRGLDSRSRPEAERLASAWRAFRSACSWATVDRVTVTEGFSRYLEENAATERWADQVAAAFEDAGSGGSLSDVALDIAASDRTPAAVRALFAPGLTAAEVAAAWSALGLRKGQKAVLSSLPLSVLSKLGNLEGVAYWARDTANRVVLQREYAQVKVDLAAAKAALQSAEHESAAAFRGLVAAFETRYRALRNIRATIREKRYAGHRYLVMLTDDQPPLAAVSIGNLDTADSVTWTVPGMNTTTADMSVWTRGSQHLYDKQGERGGPEHRAVLSWIGYRTPGYDSVLGMGHATAGAERLAASIRGLNAVRDGAMPTTNIVAHSYGTTTSALALTKAGVGVDRFVSLGSAGLPNAVDTAAKLQADHVYAAQAKDVNPVLNGHGDGWAGVGRTFGLGHRVDPTDDAFGATTFGADGGTASDGTKLNAVTNHGPVLDDGTGYLDEDTETLYNAALATIGRDADLTPAHAQTGAR